MMKKTFFVVVLLIGILSIISVNAEEVETDITVARAVICKDIQNREPVDTGISFTVDVGKIYFFTEIKASKSGQVKHIWYFNGVELSEVELDYHPGSFRTWSYSRVNPDQKGEWSVEIVSDSKVLNRLTFQIE